MIGVVVLMLLLFTGGGSDLSDLINGLSPAPQSHQPIDPAKDPDADLVEFLGAVLAIAR